jgi:hypothetical protein
VRRRRTRRWRPGSPPSESARPGSSHRYRPRSSGAIAPERHGQAAGAAITLRELGGILGVAIAAAVFTAHGSTATARDFLAGARPALFVAALTVGVATLAALALPRRASVGRPSSAVIPAPAPGAA